MPPAAPEAGRLAEPPELAAAARAVFGGGDDGEGGVDLARRYAGHLATTAVERGLVGPREVPRLWERHVLNCAVVGELLPPAALVVDVGSGAGLPGLCLALARPDATVVLVEPLERRATWLSEVVEDLGLVRRVRVVRARAEEVAPGRPGALPAADVVTARAVAPLERLAGWCLPLARRGGVLLALKGRTAAEELLAARAALERLGGRDPEVVQVGTGLVPVPTTVVSVTVGAAPHPVGGARGGEDVGGRSRAARERARKPRG
ncbi:16S rRNA (guanine(527)-N(7))-methyltransferase RsmG [Quadrisphaera sp. KR29]|uniref:16S rRNA (guanine(527)-N(7))-methyltransferase RsmG n=1 Tax=Quadrisphaera sp. KR29 TaxID=3461391 RepID=UPI0040445F4A